MNFNEKRFIVAESFVDFGGTLELHYLAQNEQEALQYMLDLRKKRKPQSIHGERQYLVLEVKQILG